MWSVIYSVIRRNNPLNGNLILHCESIHGLLDSTLIQKNTMEIHSGELINQEILRRFENWNLVVVTLEWYILNWRWLIGIMERNKGSWCLYLKNATMIVRVILTIIKNIKWNLILSFHENSATMTLEITLLVYAIYHRHRCVKFLTSNMLHFNGF